MRVDITSDAERAATRAAIAEAIATKRVLDALDVDVHRTATLHWHPTNAPCPEHCPARSAACARVAMVAMHPWYARTWQRWLDALD